MESKIPNSEQAWIPTEKLVNYLLSNVHPVGRSKAGFFRSCGYSESNLDVLKRDLLSVLIRSTSADLAESQFGRKYLVRGSVITPTGKTIEIQTVWIIESHDPRPRFVTAYPK